MRVAAEQICVVFAGVFTGSAIVCFWEGSVVGTIVGFIDVVMVLMVMWTFFSFMSEKKDGEDQGD